MSVWLVMPTANPDQANKCIARWRSRFYKIATLTDDAHFNDLTEIEDDLHMHVPVYKGWPWSINLLAHTLFRCVEFDWIVAAGDDMDCDPNKTADEIAEECTRHFNGTYGVMQPTGDRWDEINGLAASERICGSPWMGRSWLASKQFSPFDERFFHYFADEKMHDELIDTPVLWQRRDLSHYHHHPQREGRKSPRYIMERHAKVWSQDQATFRKWQADRAKGWA